jgi:hypothetical protein
MAALEIYADSYQALGFDLPAAIATYQAELAAFAATENQPAPAADPLVVRIVKEHDGQFLIVMPPLPVEPTALPRDRQFYRLPTERHELLEWEKAKLKAREQAPNAEL